MPLSYFEGVWVCLGSYTGWKLSGRSPTGAGIGGLGEGVIGLGLCYAGGKSGKSNSKSGI